MADVEDGGWRRRIWRIREGGGSCLPSPADLGSLPPLQSACPLEKSPELGQPARDTEVQVLILRLRRQCGRRRPGGRGRPDGRRSQATAAVVGAGGGDDRRVHLGRGRRGRVQHLVTGAPLRRAHRREGPPQQRAPPQCVDTLLHVRHPHIVRLLAFCDQQGWNTEAREGYPRCHS